MHTERSREILRILERAAADHLVWLMKVHGALMFPDKIEVPQTSLDPLLSQLCGENCGKAELLQPLVAAQAQMQERAEVLLAGAAERGVDPTAYQAFMAAVDSYAREARRIEAHFHRLLVETDPLTGVWNRQGMIRDLRREWARSLRTGHPACVALADLDHFKVVNDTYGHSAGDRVLCMAARFFQRRLRPYDMVYRYGGEEFLFCLPDIDCATARRVLDRLRALMARLPVVLEGGERVTITCSIGVAPLAPAPSVQAAIDAADRALYAAKAAGRNCVAVAPTGESDPDVFPSGGHFPTPVERMAFRR
ncbi:MAG: diguanylate cyclase [Magnetospirillum sp.]|nr:diguanylate cyclase [Magnetospirillum sp.]